MARDIVKYPKDTKRNKEALQRLWKKGTKFVRSVNDCNPEQWAKVMAALPPEDRELVEAVECPKLSDQIKKLYQWAKKKFGSESNREEEYWQMFTL
jgi:hypothetical protein